MHAYPAVWRPQPDFHPEFGYLCPAPRMRRSIRRSMACMMIGMMIGVIGAVAITHRAARDGEDGGRASAAPIDTAQAPLIESPVAGVSPGRSTDRPAAAAPQAKGPCEDPVAAFLNQACSSAKSRARHAARTKNHLATVTSGTVSASPRPTDIE